MGLIIDRSVGRRVQSLANHGPTIDVAINIPIDVAPQIMHVAGHQILLASVLRLCDLTHFVTTF